MQLFIVSILILVSLNIHSPSTKMIGRPRYKSYEMVMCDTLMTNDYDYNYVRIHLDSLFSNDYSLSSKGKNFLSKIISCYKTSDSAYFDYSINYQNIDSVTLSKMFSEINNVFIMDSIDLDNHFIIRAERRINPRTFKMEAPPFPNPTKYFTSKIKLDYDYMEFVHYDPSVFFESKRFWSQLK